MKPQYVAISVGILFILGLMAYRSFHHSGYDSKRNLYTVSSEDQEMNQAIATAKGTVGEFREFARKNPGIDISVKVPIRDNGETEHFWLEETIMTADGFSGKIGNDAELVKNVKYGDPIKVANGDISDWMYIKDGKMYGNYTLRVEINHMPKDEADKLRARFKLDY